MFVEKNREEPGGTQGRERWRKKMVPCDLSPPQPVTAVVDNGKEKENGESKMGARQRTR